MLIDRQRLEPGTYDASWGGLNRIGRPARAGDYHLVVTCDGEQQQKTAFSYSGGPASRLSFTPVRQPHTKTALPEEAHEKDYGREKTTKTPTATTFLRGFVHSFSREEALAGATVKLVDEQGRMFSARTNGQGRYQMAVPLPSDTVVCRMAVAKKGFAPTTHG
ncbi:MAG: carboxypeptidase-like regulatory domain-containing protein [Bacteroidales bacterium]|nr:carboxypeptidase-like regulatory domain-containing protein [Bacteroidales bacterium]